MPRRKRLDQDWACGDLAGQVGHDAEMAVILEGS